MLFAAIRTYQIRIIYSSKLKKIKQTNSGQQQSKNTKGSNDKRSSGWILSAVTRQRAYLSSFPKPRLNASLTVEAALCFPLVIAAIFLLSIPLRVIESRRLLQNTMERNAKHLALGAYAASVGEEFLDPKSDTAAQLSSALSGISLAGAGIDILRSLDSGLFCNAHFSELRGAAHSDAESPASAIGAESSSGNAPVSRTDSSGNETSTAPGASETPQNDLITLRLEYDVRLPFRFFSFDRIPMSSVSSRRAWVGADGGRGRARYASRTDDAHYDLDTDGNRIVYVGKNGTRYHKNRHCHYLDNKMTMVSGAEIDTLRNASGGVYHACSSCKPDKSGSVYIFENGSSYHSSEACKSLASYAQSIKLSEAEHLGPCSYCSAD